MATDKDLSKIDLLMWMFNNLNAEQLKEIKHHVEALIGNEIKTPQLTIER